MTPARKQRLTVILFIVFGVGVTIALLLSALNENINLFYTPTQIAEGEAIKNQRIRVGGMVVEGSVSRESDGLTVGFALTDTAHEVKVMYTGILPDLFREGQGIIALGELDANNVFVAEQVLAKHDENYMPPEVADALKKAHQNHKANPNQAGNYQ